MSIRRTIPWLSRAGALAALAWLFVACAAEDEPFTVTGGACVPGAAVVCACPGGGQGVQVCNAEGSALGACENCEAVGSGGGAGAPACTLFPDCNGCQGCWQTCICQSGNLPGCKETCGVTGVGGSGGGTGGGGSCTVAKCPDPGVPLGAKCCTTSNKCGFEISLLGPGCKEGNQPGKPDASCPGITFSGFTLEGCCKPNGKCGAQDTFLGLGCVDPADFGQPPGPSCTP